MGALQLSPNDAVCPETCFSFTELNRRGRVLGRVDGLPGQIGKNKYMQEIYRELWTCYVWAMSTAKKT